MTRRPNSLRKTSSIPLSTVSFQLTEEDIARYREEIERFPVQKEEEILSQLAGKLQTLGDGRSLSTFVVDLIRDIELLYDALQRGESLSLHLRKMIFFALNYFIEIEDEVPDRIGVLGYVDDAVVIRWVVDEIKRSSPEILSRRR